MVLLPVSSEIPSVYWSGVGTYRSTRPETGMLLRGDGPLDPRLFSPQPTPPGGTQPTISPTTSEPPSAFDAGLMALREGEHALAVAALRRHLRAHPDDAPAMRALAIALIETKAFDDAAGVMRSAYRADPHQAAEPLFPAAIGYTNAPYRSVLTRAVSYANRVNTASGWLLVAVLMQGEGRGANAKVMLDKAAKLGLESPIADSLAAEMNR
ncbi:MAG: hypothetical protein HBSAPP03_17830 [Phycisphaerae bacterium]|nr:MAG: hypothetical protein HBSAPP03_17830 [Phycisphaerae bacterium]